MENKKYSDKIETISKKYFNRHLTDLGIYIVTHSKENDPLELGSLVGRKLGLDSIDRESLLAAIHVVRHYGVDDDLKEKAERFVSGFPYYEKLKEILE